MSLARERLQAALSFREADRIPVIPFVLGAARRVAEISFQEWSLDPELAARAMMESQELLVSNPEVSLQSHRVSPVFWLSLTAGKIPKEWEWI